MTPQSPSKQAPWDLTQLSQSPSAAPSYFPESHQQCEISSLSKVILVLGKAKNHKAPKIWAVVGLSHLGDLMFCQKTLHKTWCMSKCIGMMKLPITSCSELQPFSSYCISQPTKNIEVVLLINCLAWRAYLWWITPFQSKNTVNVVIILLRPCLTFGHKESGDLHWDDWAFVSRL